MSAAVPLVIDSKAARLIHRLGVANELDAMLEWVKSNVPGLQGVRVEANLRGYSVREEFVVIWAHQQRGGPAAPEGEHDRAFIEWKLANFPFELARNVSMWPTFAPMADDSA